MREQVTPARRLPFQILEIGLGESNEHQILLAGEMTRRRFPRLVGGGKMNEAIRVVHGRTTEHTITQGILPRAVRENFVEESHEAGP